MTWQIPEFEPASRYSIQITGNDVYLKVRELDDSLVGTDDYLGFAYWWCGGDGVSGGDGVMSVMVLVAAW